MNKEEYNDRLMSAWRKICAWCKENCNGKFVNGKHFRTPHNPYVWVSLVVNDEGDCFIYGGDHSSECPNWVMTEERMYGFDTYCIGSSHPRGDNNHIQEFEMMCEYNLRIPYEKIEMMVRMWPQLKSQILTEMRLVDSVVDFQV